MEKQKSKIKTVELYDKDGRRNFRVPPKPNYQKSGNKSSRLKGLVGFPEIDRMIKEGYGTKYIANYIHNELGECWDLTTAALEHQISQYKKTIPPIDIAKVRMPDRVHRAMERLENGIDEINELARLYRKQMDRIDIDTKLEKQINKLFPTMNAEMNTALKILQVSSNLKQELGITPKNLGTLNLDTRILASVNMPGNDTVRRVTSSPESRKKLITIVDKLIDLKPELQAKVQVDSKRVEYDSNNGNGNGGGKASVPLTLVVPKKPKVQKSKKVKSSGGNGKKGNGKLEGGNGKKTG